MWSQSQGEVAIIRAMGASGSMVPGDFPRCVRELKMSMGTPDDGAHAGDGQDAIQHAARAALEYRGILTAVRLFLGAIMGFFGAVAIWHAIDLMEAGYDIAVVGLVAGVLVIVTAIITAIWPSPRTLALGAIAFLAIAAWYITLVVLTGGEAIDLAIWAVCTTGIAICLLAAVPRFSRMADTKPSAETLKQLADIADSIRKAKVQQEPDISEFQTFKQGTWRLRLTEPFAIAVSTRIGADMFFVSPDELDVVDHTKPGKDPKRRKVTLRVRGMKWKAKLPRSDFQRLMQWKGDEQQEPPAGSPTSKQQPEQL